MQVITRTRTRTGKDEKPVVTYARTRGGGGLDQYEHVGSDAAAVFVERSGSAWVCCTPLSSRRIRFSDQKAGPSAAALLSVFETANLAARITHHSVAILSSPPPGVHTLYGVRTLSILKPILLHMVG